MLELVFESVFFDEVVFIEATDGIGEVFDGFWLGQGCSLVGGVLGVLEMIEFDSNGVGHRYSRCNEFLVLDLRDIQAYEADNITNEVGGDSMWVCEVVLVEWLWRFFLNVIDRGRDEGGIVSFGLASEEVEFRVVMREVFGEMMFDEVAFSFHRDMVFLINELTKFYNGIRFAIYNFCLYVSLDKWEWRFE